MSSVIQFKHIFFVGCAAEGVDDITTPESLQFDLATIEAATNKFSADYKLGEGGFGEVYKVQFEIYSFYLLYRLMYFFWQF